MPLSGMTGFAREEGGLAAWSWSVEARSVNGRNLDVRFRGPPGFDALERIAREGAQARFHRGQLSVGLTAKRADAAGQVRVNSEQLDAYLTLAQSLAGKASPPTIDGLLSLRGVIEAADETDDAETRAAVEAAMGETIGRALDGLKMSRAGEGEALAPVLSQAVQTIADLTAVAETQAGDQPAILKERFERRMSELLADRADLSDRIVQEAAVMAAKADVREELDRLKAHVAAARELLASGQAAGRRLDFLMQEFMREANTLCSKSATTALTATGLELKAVIEQLREQVQNVE